MSKERESAYKYSPLPHLQAVFHLGKTVALSQQKKAFPKVRCQQPSSGWAAAATAVVQVSGILAFMQEYCLIL